MNIDNLQVRMFGELSLQLGGETISSNRSGKVWLLLAYLIYYRSRHISQEELFNLLWGNDENSDDPQNALKAMVHRTRATLDQLGKSVGRELIVFREGRYMWNPEVTFSLDADDFTRLCHFADSTAADDPERLNALLQAIRLYQGEFLSRFSTESWVLPTSVFFHNQYLKAVGDALELLEAAQEQEQAADVCRSALKLEPYSEDLYRHLLRNLVDCGCYQDAVSAYESMSDKFFAAFGVMPSDDIRSIYREAASRVNAQTLSPEIVHEQMKELMIPPGAMICDYDFFRLLYQANARSIARSGDAIHIGLMSLRSKDGTEVSRRVIDHAVENLLKQIQQNLRNGDVTSRCSVSQVILMLPQANYENSCMVCDRVIRSFRQTYPHSAVDISYSVQPMEPAELGLRPDSGKNQRARASFADPKV